MSKKKNTLKDLDEFLKQQAASLVSPEKLSEKIPEPVRPEPAPVTSPSTPTEEVSVEKIFRDLTFLSGKEGSSFRRKLYDLIINSLEAQGQTSPEDKMLINTVLYLKHGENWQAGIQAYWKNK